MKNKIKVGEGYRRIRNNEVLKETDEIFDSDGTWKKTIFAGMKAGHVGRSFIYRRKVK